MLELLAMQFARVQEWSMLCCRGLEDEQLFAVPAGAGNHILWELGHICLTRSYLIIWGCADGKRLPARWEASFGFGSKVHTRAKDYPSLADIRQELDLGGQVLADYIQTLTADDLDDATPNLPEHLFANRRAAFVHLLSHEAYHIGKLSLLRKPLGLRTISELYFGS